MYGRQRHFYRAHYDCVSRAAYALRKESPIDSAYGVLSANQKVISLTMLCIMIGAILLVPRSSFVAISAILSTYFFCAALYRAMLMGVAQPPTSGVTDSELNDDQLPVITILAPLYQDAVALPELVRALTALDYPANKLDIKLLLESDDETTLNAAKGLHLKAHFTIISIPDVGPRTKPKACNVGLESARGEITVIYDAEDRPEIDQLKKAVSHFSQADARVVCLQAKLGYYNARENWLTRLFTLEYALWFEWLLPALQKLDAPMPLGGTSNFFRTAVLKRVGGWDPYNVTEDADLGLRLHRYGYRTAMLASTTYEEANCQLGNWVRQRSRWIKGHFQTWLVHMRRPVTIIDRNGLRGFIAIQLFFAGNVFSALINPILWLFFLAGLTNIVSWSEIPGWLIKLNLTTLIAGNFAFIVFLMIAPREQKLRDLGVFAITAPIYWMLTSFAAYKALTQLVTRPYYWEKTDHMISRIAYRKP